MAQQSSEDRPAVCAVGLAKSYGFAVAVTGLDMHVTAGETVALVGPNGARKTTTIGLLPGLLSPSRGQVLVYGARLSGADSAASDVPSQHQRVWADALFASMLQRCDGPCAGQVREAAAATATGVGLGFAAARGYPIALSAATIARYGAGAALGAGLLAAGAGAGSLIRHQIGAIIAVFAWAFAVELVVGGTATAVAPYLPYTAAALMAGVTSGGGMPPIARRVTALPFPAAAVVAGVAILLAAAAAATTVRRDIT